MPRRAALLALALLLSPSVALAQLAHPLCSGGNSAQSSLVGGTTGANMLRTAVVSNGLAYGAASVLDRKILPVIQGKGLDVDGVFHEDFVSTNNVLRAPMCLDEQGRRVAMAKVDLSTSTFGGAFRAGPFTFFLAGSGTTWSAGRKNNERIGLAFGGFVGVVPSLIAPIKRSFFNGILTTDLILGTSLQHKSVGAVGVGYLASQGFFTNITEHHVRLFATSLLNDGLALDRIPYLNVGISQFDWLLGKDLEKTIGYISPSIRQNIFLTRPPVNLTGELPGEVEARSAGTELLRTLNLDRIGAGDFLDARVSYAIEPRPAFYEGSVVLHTRDFLPERYLLQSGRDAAAMGARLTVGAINMPPLYYYGVPGGVKPRVQVDWMGVVPMSRSSMRFYITLGINASDTLAVYPFAYNAFHMGISLSTVSWR